MHFFESAAAIMAILLAAIGVARADEARRWPDIPPSDAARLKTRVLCSCLFVQEMSMQQCTDGRSALWRYLFPTPTPLLANEKQRLATAIDSSGAAVELFEGRMLLARSRYVDDGGGCVTVHPGEKAVGAPSRIPMRSPAPLPRRLPASQVDSEAVRQALDEGFSPGGPLRGYARATLLVHDGRVVAERYAPGFGPHHRYYLGSVSKVFNNLLAGLLVRDAKLRVDAKVALEPWRTPGDPRGAITFDHLLHMTSGLDWTEEFFVPGAPAYNVYFAGPASFDVAGYVASRPAAAAPGTQFEYSTGASTLLTRALQARLGRPGREPLLRYFARELFEPLGATGITIEFDAAGTFLAGHATYARTEDLARVGMLLLQDGRWNGKQVLPDRWVAYATRPAQQAAGADSRYGAQLQLDIADVRGCFGHHGVGKQYLIVCPARRLVVVWFSSAFDFSPGSTGTMTPVMRRLVEAFPEAQ